MKLIDSYKKILLCIGAIALSQQSTVLFAQASTIQAPTTLSEEIPIAPLESSSSPSTLETLYGSDGYLAQFSYSMGEYADKHENEIKERKGELKTDVSSMTGSFGYLQDKTHLLRLNVSTGSSEVEEWISRTEYDVSYGFVFEIVGEIIPMFGIRSITNEVELDKQLSPKISVLGSTDYFAGVEYTITVADFSGIAFLGTGKYLAINPGNNFDFGSQATAKLGIMYQTGGFKALFEVGAVIEKYQARQAFDTDKQESLTVDSEINSIIVSVGGWYDPNKAPSNPNEPPPQLDIQR